MKTTTLVATIAAASTLLFIRPVFAETYAGFPENVELTARDHHMTARNRLWSQVLKSLGATDRF